MAGIVTVYINGILSPKDEGRWETMRGILQRTFKGEAYHIHNNFISVNQDDVINSIAQNPQLAFALAALSATSFMMFSTSAPGTQAKSLRYIALALHDVLRSRAISFQQELALELEMILINYNKHIHQVGIGQEAKILNIYAHSHGGMCISEFLKSEQPRKLQEKYGITINIYVGGCPIVVNRYHSGINQLIQIHNKRDPLSLLFEKGLVNVPAHVIETVLDGTHDSLMYADALQDFVYLGKSEL